MTKTVTTATAFVHEGRQKEVLQTKNKIYTPQKHVQAALRDRINADVRRKDKLLRNAIRGNK